MEKFNLLALLCTSLFAQNSFADNEPFLMECTRNTGRYVVSVDRNQDPKVVEEKLHDGTMEKVTKVCRNICDELYPISGLGSVACSFKSRYFSVECDDDYIANRIKCLKFGGNIMNGYKVSDEFFEKYEQLLRSLKNKNAHIAKMMYIRDELPFSEDEMTILNDLLKKYGELIEEDNNAQENNVANGNTTHKDSGFLGFNRVRSFFSDMIKKCKVSMGF